MPPWAIQCQIYHFSSSSLKYLDVCSGIGTLPKRRSTKKQKQKKIAILINSSAVCLTHFFGNFIQIKLRQVCSALRWCRYTVLRIMCPVRHFTFAAAIRFLWCCWNIHWTKSTRWSLSLPLKIHSRKPNFRLQIQKTNTILNDDSFCLFLN